MATWRCWPTCGGCGLATSTRCKRRYDERSLCCVLSVLVSSRFLWGHLSLSHPQLTATPLQPASGGGGGGGDAATLATPSATAVPVVAEAESDEMVLVSGTAPVLASPRTATPVPERQMASPQPSFEGLTNGHAPSTPVLEAVDVDLSPVGRLDLAVPAAAANSAAPAPADLAIDSATGARVLRQTVCALLAHAGFDGTGRS